MMAASREVIIVGGGVIGCSIAFHLAKVGIKALVLERGRLGAQASNAASGVLVTSPGAHPYQRLGRESLGLFHRLAEELKEMGGVDMELVQCGELDLALREDEEHQLRRWVERSNELGGSSQWLNQKAVHELEPGLNTAVLGAIYSPEVCRVNNQRLTEAFARAGRRLGAEFRQGAEVVGLIRDGPRITGVRLLDQELHADQVVLAAGPWSKIIADRVGRCIPVRPVRGQNVNLQPVAGGIKTVIHGSGWYLVPRNDGSIMAGATVEEAGFDNRVTAGGVGTILGIATALIPSLKDASINWTIAGLRPGSPDDMPLLGPILGWDGLSLASGHYRNGILLSPITGQLIANHFTGGDVALLSVFRPDRFHSSS